MAGQEIKKIKSAGDFQRGTQVETFEEKGILGGKLDHEGPA